MFVTCEWEDGLKLWEIDANDELNLASHWKHGGDWGDGVGCLLFDGQLLHCGERAGYRWSRPECRRLTIGPNSDAAKSTSTGVAAHIRAAAEGGPRFDPDQT